MTKLLSRFDAGLLSPFVEGADMDAEVFGASRASLRSPGSSGGSFISHIPPSTNGLVTQPSEGSSRKKSSLAYLRQVDQFHRCPTAQELDPLCLEAERVLRFETKKLDSLSQVLNMNRILGRIGSDRLAAIIAERESARATFVLMTKSWPRQNVRFMGATSNR